MFSLRRKEKIKLKKSPRSVILNHFVDEEIRENFMYQKDVITYFDLLEHNKGFFQKEDHGVSFLFLSDAMETIIRYQITSLGIVRYESNHDDFKRVMELSLLGSTKRLVFANCNIGRKSEFE